MLVIVSDLHLGDGSCARTIPADAFDRFAVHLEQLAYRASWRTDGRYHPLGQVDVLLLGDVLEMLNTTAWNDPQVGGEALPWSDPASPAMQAKVAAIVERALEHNAPGLAVLRDLAAGRRLHLPPAYRGQPDRASAERFPLEVRLHYLIGNHDWYLCLPGAAYDAVRQRVVEAMGLSQPPTPFPYDPDESEVLRDLLRTHQVFARHGDLYDTVNYNVLQNRRDVASLGDAIATLLFNRFPLEVEARLGDDLPKGFYRNLRELVNVRPALVAPVWVISLIEQYDLAATLAEQVKAVWDELAAAFLDDPFVRQFDRPGLDLVDMLQAVLLFSRLMSFSGINQVLEFVYRRLWGGDVSFAEHALKESAFQTRQARFIVFGHTHKYEVVSLEMAEREGLLFPQMYLNSGTWHTYHDLAVAQPEKKRFLHYRVMAYLAFFRGDEHEGQRFEGWSGAVA